MSTVVLAELPTTEADRYWLLVADGLDTAREQLRQAFGLFRLRGFAPCRDKAEAHRLARLIRSHASSTSSTGALAFTERSLATAISALKPIDQQQELEQAAMPCQKPFGDELAAIHADAPLLWAEAYHAACDYVIDAHGFNRELRIELGTKLLGRLRTDLLNGDESALRSARIAHMQRMKPDALPAELRDKTTTELQHEPFQLAPEPVAVPAPAPAPPAAAKKPAAPAKPSRSFLRGYLEAVAASSVAGLFAIVPAFFGVGLVGTGAAAISCSNAGLNSNRCHNQVMNQWMTVGISAAVGLAFTGVLFSCGVAAGNKEGKA